MSISGLMTPLHIIPKLTFKILAHLCSVLPVVTGKNPYLLWGITALSPCHLLCLVLELPPYQVLEVPHQPISIYPPQHRLNGEESVWPRRMLPTTALTESDAMTQSGSPHCSGHLGQDTNTTAHFHGVGEPPAPLAWERHFAEK